MDDAEFHKRLDATIVGKPDETSALSSEPLHEAYAAFHGIATPIPRCRPATITSWFVEYDSPFSPPEVRAPEETVAFISEMNDRSEAWRTALGDSILRNLVLEYEADLDTARDWSGCDVEIRKADKFRWEHFESPQGGLVKIDPAKGKFAVCERVPPERINGYDIDPLRGLPARLAQRFKSHQFETLRNLAGSVEAMADCKFGVAVDLTEKPRLRIRYDQVTEEIVFVAIGYFGAAVIA